MFKINYSKWWEYEWFVFNILLFHRFFSTQKKEEKEEIREEKEREQREERER